MGWGVKREAGEVAALSPARPSPQGTREAEESRVVKNREECLGGWDVECMRKFLWDSVLPWGADHLMVCK